MDLVDEINERFRAAAEFGDGPLDRNVYEQPLAVWHERRGVSVALAVKIDACDVVRPGTQRQRAGLRR